MNKSKKEYAGSKSRPANGPKKPQTTAEKSYGQRLRQKAEEYLSTNPYRIDETCHQKEYGELVHELSTYQIELELQNEELRRAQQELEKSRQRLFDLYDFAPVGYFTFDTKGLVVSVNQTGAVMLAMAKSKLLRSPFKAFVHPEDADRFHIYLRKTIRTEEKQVEEFRVYSKDHDQMWVQLESMAIRDDNNKVVEIRTTATDITKRVRTEQKLQHKSSLLRGIIDSTDIMLAYLDLEFNFLWVNPAYAKNCKMAPEELAGRNHFELYPDRENEEIFRLVRETGKSVFFKDKPYESPDPPERDTTYFDWSLVPVKDAAGNISALVYSLRETTKYRVFQLQLEEREEQFRLIADNSADVIFQMETNGCVSYMSPAVSTFGYRPNEVLGRNFRDFIADKDIDRAELAWQQILNGEQISLLELNIKRKDGSFADCEINASPIMIGSKVVNILGITRDITDRKRMEIALRENEAKLQTTLDNLAEGVVVSDLHGKLVYWNTAALSMLGYTPEEEYLLNLPEYADTFVFSTPEKGILPLEEWPLSRILTGETLERTEIEVRRSDMDIRRICRFSGALARDSKNNPLMAVMTIADITQRKQAEEKVLRSNSVLQGIKEIFEAGLRCSSDAELAVETLRVAERVTESRFGFINEIGPDGLLHDTAISDPGLKECAINDKKGHRTPLGNFKITGLYGHVLSQGTAFFTNEPSKHQASVGTPEGHPTLQCFLGVPIVHANTTIGVIALANREGGYGDEDIESVSALADAYREILFKCRMERELADSEARERNNAKLFKQFLDFTPIPVWIAHDPECKVITGNRAAADLLGVAADRNILQATGPDAQKPKIKFFRDGKELAMTDMPLHYAVRNAVTINDVEMDIITTSKKAVRMIGAATPLYDEQDNVSGGIGAFIDITERKRLEEELIHAKKEWERTFDAVPDLIAILDPQHRIIRTNKAMAEAIGSSPGQCIGKHCFTGIHRSSSPTKDCPNLLTLQDGLEHTAVIYDKKLGKYYLVTTTPFFNVAGEIISTVHVARDITRLKKTEILLLNNEKRFNSAQKLAHLGSWELDTVNNVQTWSDETFRILGLKPQSFLPCHEDFFEYVHPDDRQNVHDAYFNSMREDTDDRHDVTYRIVKSPDGEIRHIHERCRHIRDENGRIIKSEGMVHDITETVLAEQQVHRLNEELQQRVEELAVINREYERSNEDLQQYAYIISHDLQEPLRTVSGFVKLLSRRYKGRLDDKADTFIKHAIEGSSRMQQLMLDLLEFSKVGCGKLNLKPVSLDTIVEKTLSDLTYSITQHRAKLEFDQLPTVTADELQLTHLFQNLINNALKFHGKRDPHISISAEKKNEEWIISVRDNGIGIEPRFADRIFLLFQRLHRREEYSGTGLGLAICKKVVERHGGRIWVESEPGIGSTFYFSLPATRKDLQPE